MSKKSLSFLSKDKLKMYIYQIEISNHCSLTCNYCPHRHQKRQKGFMSFETFKKCVQLFKSCENNGKLYLHNFGEPLLNPMIFDFIRFASKEKVECTFFTNGVDENGNPFGRDVYQQLRDCGMRSIDFSAHSISVKKFQEIVGDSLQISNLFVPSKDTLGNWGGQIKNIVCPTDNRICIFERKNCFVVLWDGTIASCCIDVEGNPRTLHVDELLGGTKYRFQRISLCDSCYAMRDDEEL